MSFRVNSDLTKINAAGKKRRSCEENIWSFGFPHIIVFLTLLFPLNLTSLSFHRSPLLSPLPSPYTAPLSFHRSPPLSPLPYTFTSPLSFYCSPLLSLFPSPFPTPLLSLLSSPFNAPLSFHRSSLLLPLLSPFTAPLSFHHLFLQNPTTIGCCLPLLKTVDFILPKSTKIKNSFSWDIIVSCYCK